METNAKTTGTRTTAGVHPFERAGLGAAPYALSSVFEMRGPITLPGGMTSGAPGQPMGSCDFCGTGIATCFRLRGADGREFVVGSDCVRRACDQYDGVVSSEVVRQVEREVARLRKIAKDARDESRIAVARVALEDPAVVAALSARPHPQSWAAEKGWTMLDSARWTMKNAGTKGRLEVARMVEKL